MSTALPSAFDDLRRRELAADLGRGAYVLRQGDAAHERRYFRKALVLSRPGLVRRAAQLLAPLVAEACECLAVTSVPSAVLGGALAQAIGVSLLLGEAEPDGTLRFDGELYPGLRVVLLEDVVYTGGHALAGVRALTAAAAVPLGVLTLLDRELGAAQRLAEEDVPLRALFAESELLALAHGAGE